MLLGILGGSLLGNLLTGKGTIKQVRAQLQLARIFDAALSVNKFLITKFYQNEPKFIGVYSRNNLPKIKDGIYVINLDEYESIGTHWIALYINNNNATYFDSFGVEHIPNEIKKIYRKQKYNNKYL